jgi:hypothetical protein
MWGLPQAEHIELWPDEDFLIDGGTIRRVDTLVRRDFRHPGDEQGSGRAYSNHLRINATNVSRGRFDNTVRPREAQMSAIISPEDS